MNVIHKLLPTRFTRYLIVFMMLGVSIPYFLSGCNSSEGKITQPGKAITVTFDLLSGYDYAKEPMPEIVKSLEGQRVAVTGFMLPLDFDENTVKNFLLLQSQAACCFGMTPEENEFVYVEMSGGKSARYMPDVPITVVGKIEIGKKLLVDGIYSMEADNIVVFDGF